MLVGDERAAWAAPTGCMTKTLGALVMQTMSVGLSSAGLQSDGTSVSEDRVTLGREKKTSAFQEAHPKREGEKKKVYRNVGEYLLAGGVVPEVDSKLLLTAGEDVEAKVGTGSTRETFGRELGSGSFADYVGGRATVELEVESLDGGLSLIHI